MTDIARAVGALWRAATPADKAPYEAKAAEDKLRYQREIDALPEEERPKPKPRKRKPAAPKKPPKEKPPPKRPRKPKQPAGRPKPKGALSAYMFFVKAKRASVLADHPEMAGSVTEAAKATAPEVSQKVGEDLTSSSGKLATLDGLLQKLLPLGHL